MAKQQSGLDRFLRFFSSLKCGLILLGILGVAVIMGTLILQRPLAKEGEIEQIYAPQTIRLLDSLGLFDIFHAWWFILLLGLLGATIALASLERLPEAWRLFARPHVLAEEWFVRRQPFQREIPLGSCTPEEALALASRKLAKLGYPAHAEALRKGTLYIDKYRAARLAPYVVHVSLLIIFAGAIIDGVWGYRGFVTLGPGMRSQSLEPLTPQGTPRGLGFTLRCDGAGMEKYPDGSPRQYWSRLAVEQNGREVFHKQISVNDPLTYKGVRFFQANYGSTGTPSKLVLEATWSESGKVGAETFDLRPDQPVRLTAQGSVVELADFVPDFVMQGDQISSRSDEPRNPALRLRVTRPDGKRASVWIFPKAPERDSPNDLGIGFRLRDLEMAYMTGLQVAHEPGQDLIWIGCLTLTGGLMMALYLSHLRIWGVVGRDRKGRPVLILGGQQSKNRERFQERFDELAGALQTTFGAHPAGVRELMAS